MKYVFNDEKREGERKKERELYKHRPGSKRASERVQVKMALPLSAHAVASPHLDCLEFIRRLYLLVYMVSFISYIALVVSKST